jgi:hypothetical protein
MSAIRHYSSSVQYPLLGPHGRGRRSEEPRLNGPGGMLIQSWLCVPNVWPAPGLQGCSNDVRRCQWAMKASAIRARADMISQSRRVTWRQRSIVTDDSSLTRNIGRNFIFNRSVKILCRYPVGLNPPTPSATPKWGRGNALDFIDYFSGMWWAPRIVGRQYPDLTLTRRS